MGLKYAVDAFASAGKFNCCLTCSGTRNQTFRLEKSLVLRVPSMKISTRANSFGVLVGGLEFSAQARETRQVASGILVD
jgi:hypothetical protein